MYLSFYGLNKPPFILNPDPDFLYLSEMHRAALTRMECSLLNQAPFTVLSGNIGMGKTTLIRHLLNLMYKNKQYTIGLVTNTHPSVQDLLKWILFSFGLDFQTDNNVKAHQIFYNFLEREYAKNRHVILIIDEAQNLNVDALEELRLLSNININKHQVLQTFIVGQESLLEMLKRPELTQFAQRVAYSYHLEPFNRFDTHAYILHRLEIAGAQYRPIFSIAASERIYHYSKGIPRLINVLCDTALIYGFAEDKQQIDTDIIDNVVLDKKYEGILPLSNQMPSLDDQLPNKITSLYTTMAENAVRLKVQKKKKPELKALDFNQKIREWQSNYSQQAIESPALLSTDKNILHQQKTSQAKLTKGFIRFLFPLIAKIKEYWQRCKSASIANGLHLRSWSQIKWEFLKIRGVKSWERFDNWCLTSFKKLVPLKDYVTPLYGGVLLLSFSCLFIGYSLFNHSQSQEFGIANNEIVAINRAYLIKEQPNFAKLNTQEIKGQHDLSDKFSPLYLSKKSTIARKSSIPSPKENHKLQKIVVVQAGNSLKKIITKEFGEYNQQLVNKTLSVNPNIKNIDRIFVGQIINIPQQ